LNHIIHNLQYLGRKKNQVGHKIKGKQPFYSALPLCPVAVHNSNHFVEKLIEIAGGFENYGRIINLVVCLYDL